MKKLKNKRKNNSIRFNESFWGYAFIIIPFLGMIIFTLIPFFMTIYSSLTSWPMGQALSDAKFIGLKNYAEAFKSDMFWKSLGNTFYYMLGIPIGLLLAVIFASLMNRDAAYEGTFRVIYYIPAICSTVAISFVFQRLFSSDGGLINKLLMKLGVENPPIWMSDPRYTKWVIIIMNVWRGLGSSIIIYVSGMQAISNDLYEAAEIDGANKLQKFTNITVPLLRPVTFYLVVTGVINGAQMYVEPRLIFEGNGPVNSTFTTVMYLYDYAFANSRAGYSSSIAIMLAIIVFGLTIVQFYINRRSRDA